MNMALITLADGNCRSSPRPRSRSPVRTANVTVPWRSAAQAAAPATSGCQRWADAPAGETSAASRIAAARRRIARRRYRRRMSYGPSTRAVHAGMPPAGQGEPLLPGPVLAAPFHLRGDPHSTPYGYGRDPNPTWTHLERAIGELDGGRTVVFSAGMAAVSAVVLPRLRPGDVFVACGDGYPGIRNIAALDLEPKGIEVRLGPTDTQAVVGAADGATPVWGEKPAQPRA